MKNFIGIKNILWDFDGVLLDSMDLRDYGFLKVLENYSVAQVDLLIQYHRKNGGLSRYHKFRYFFEHILNESVSDDQIQSLAKSFSDIMRSKLADPRRLIQDSISFVRSNYINYRMHIVSGSDQEELRYLCNKLDIKHYFHAIEGSPTPKNQLVYDLMTKFNYKENQTILIGDSQNDWEAAFSNQIAFFGYNNMALAATYPETYIHKFS
jgi:phosphoglycolate phosphatase-like HAD superfamily hydrolase